MKLDLRVFVSNQNFLSHARAAASYRAILQELCHLVDDPTLADVAVLHHETPELPQLLEDIPGLHEKYLIGYCVWEANILPPPLVRGLQLLDEVWTASAYCHGVYTQYHPNVLWVPHVVEWPHPAGDHAALGKLIDTDPGYFNYLCITQENMARKNSRGLQEAFAYVAKRVPRARLLLKTIVYPIVPDAPPVVEQRGDAITVIQGALGGSLLSALYEMSQVYVSAHCSEGWGLPLSDAMLLGKPTVATGYSGNLDFMTPANSFLVRCTEEPIRPRDHYYVFDSSMRWGYPHREHLERQMLEAYRMVQDGSVQSQIDRARQDMQCYSPERIATLLASRLTELDRAVKSHALPRFAKRRE